MNQLPMGLPHTHTPTLLQEEIMEHWRNFQDKKMNRLEYLDGLETLLLSRQSIGTRRGGRHARLDPQVVVSELRAVKSPGGLTVRELAGMMDARDAAKGKERETDGP